MDKSKETFFDATEFKNIKEIMYNSAKKYANNIAFKIKHNIEKKVEYEEITYSKFLEQINQLGTALYNLGLKGKRIAILGRNRYEWVLAHLSNLLGGIVSVPLDKELQEDELESSIVRSKADAIIFDEKYQEKVENIRERGNSNLKQYICMSELEGYLSISDLLNKGEKLLQEGKKEYINYEVDSYCMSILLFTSGTTAKSKAVMLSQNNIASNVYAMLLVEDFRTTDVNLAFLPFHHIFGSTEMIVMLASGVQTVFPDGLRYVAQNLREYKVTLFVGVPILIEAIYKNIQKEIKKQGKEKAIKAATILSNSLYKMHIDVRRKIFKPIIDQLGGNMRFIVSGGAALDKDVSKKFNELGIKLVQGYGVTETAPVIAAENYKYIKSGSVGFPMKNVEVEVVDKNNEGIGEFRVKGPNVMLGYYENSEATESVLKDGWFYTGDLGYIDKEGFMFITGRKKDMIVLKNGKKIFPEEIETRVNKLDIVEESMAYAMPDRDDDVKLAIKIVYNKEKVEEKYPNVSFEELQKIVWNEIKEVNKSFPKYKYIKHMILTDEELIKTTTKKVKRHEELKRILEEENKGK